MECKTCGKMNCMEHGGEVKKKPLPKLKRMDKGVNMSIGEEGESAGGFHARMAQKTEGEEKESNLRRSKKEHEKTLTDLESMPMPDIKGLAHGGMADEGEEMDDDEMMNHHVMGEFMDAMHKKDKKGMLDSLRAVVMNCMGGKVK